MFREQQISISERSCGKKIHLFHHRNKLHFKIYSNGKQNFTFFVVFTVFLKKSNICSLEENKGLL